MDTEKRKRLENKIGNDEERYCGKFRKERLQTFCVERKAWSEDRYYWKCPEKYDHREYIN